VTDDNNPRMIAPQRTRCHSVGIHRACNADFALVSRAGALVLALGIMLGVAPQALADPPPQIFYPGLRTGSMHFAGPGTIVVDAGIEYLPSVTNAVAGIEGNLLRLPTLGLRLGLSKQAEFQVVWPIYNRVTITSRKEPPPLGRELGDVTADFGDVVVSTLIRLQGEGHTRPAWGIKFAAKLPNTNEKLGIGVNSTDVFASLLVSKVFGERLATHIDLGVGILTEPTLSYTQNDVLTYGFLADYWTGRRLHVVGEVVGYQSTHEVGPGTTSSSELRSGLVGRFGPFDVGALLTRGLASRDSQGLGFALHTAFRFGFGSAGERSSGS